MLARVLVVALCLSVCLSVCLSQVGVRSKGMGGSAFWHGTAFDQSYTVLRKFRLFTKIRVLLLDFFLNSALIKCRHGTSFVECAINLARERWRRSEREKLYRRLSTELIINCSLSQRLPSSVYSTILSRGSISDG